MLLWARRFFALLYMFLLFHVSTTTQPKFQTSFPHLDKVLHATAYCLLAIVLLWTSRKRSWKRTLILAVTLSTGYGIFLEWMQSMTPGREGTVGDIIANCIGALVGCMIYYRGSRRPLQRQSR